MDKIFRVDGESFSVFYNEAVGAIDKEYVVKCIAGGGDYLLIPIESLTPVQRKKIEKTIRISSHILRKSIKEGKGVKPTISINPEDDNIM